MSSTLLWVLVPLAVALSLLFYRRADNLRLYLALTVSLFLTWVAWQIPIDTVLQLGPISIEIFPNLILLGRNFTLANADRPLLTFIYFAETLWLLGALLARPRLLFAPLSLAAVALFVAALSVEPFLYAALIIAAVVLLLIPLLVPPGRVAGRGLQRFLKFQFFAVPCILFTGWLLTGVEASPGNLDLVLRAGLLLALGFSFLLGLFPFHSWIPMLAEEINPYIFGFLIFFLPSIAAIFSLGFFDRYIWLRENDLVYLLISQAGTLGVLLGGLWAARERHLGRIFAFAAMVGIGSLLQAIGLRAAQGVQTFFALLVGSIWALWLCALALGLFWREGQSLRLDKLQKTFRTHPLLTIGLLAGLFSVIGLPFVGPFVAHLAVWKGLAYFSPLTLIVSLIGSLGLLSAALRVLRTWFAEQPSAQEAELPKDILGRPIQPVHDFASPYTWVLVSLSTLALLIIGLIPQVLQSTLIGLAGRFPQLYP